MKITFLSDFYSDELNGGGENNDAVLLNHLHSEQHAVTTVKNREATLRDVEQASFVIVSNFVLLSQHIIDYLIENKKYIIYEHDHKYVRTRDPSKFANYDIPDNMVINYQFYKSATEVVVLSNICKEILCKQLKLDNVHSISTSLWSKERLAHIKELLLKTDKTQGTAVVQSDNPTKGMRASLAFCQRHKIKYDLISSPNPKQFLDILAPYKNLVFIPQVLETFCRLVAEAKMLNCNVYTNPNLLGFMSEPYCTETGTELIATLEKQVDLALAHFSEVITR